MKGPLLPALAVLVLVVLGAVWFVMNYDQVSERQWQLPKEIVWRNRFLGAERMLDKLGRSSRRVDALETAETLEADWVLLVPAQRGAVSKRALVALTDFVERGGHLVVESEGMAGDDAVLDAFGVSRQAIDSKHASGNNSYWMFSEPLLKPNQRPNAGLVEIAMHQDAPKLQVFVNGGEALEVAEPILRIGSGNGTRMVQFGRGRGRVTAINDIQFATNMQIGRNDNAEFLWELIDAVPGTKGMAFFRGHQQSLARWLIEHALPVLLALGLILVAAMWRALPRLGPLLPDPEPSRRRLLDHLSASGRFLWAAGRKGTLAQAATRGAMAAVIRRYPHVGLMSESDQAQFLSAQLGLNPTMSAQLVAGNITTRNAPALIQLTRACAHLHAQLNNPADTPGPPPLRTASPPA